MPVEFKIIDGAPYIRGQRAQYDPMDSNDPLAEVFSGWRCPNCRQRLVRGSLVCLNGCALTEECRAHFDSIRKGSVKLMH